MSDKFCLTHKEKRMDAFMAASVTDCPYCEINRLEKELKEAEDRGFRNGMLHAAEKQQYQLRLLADAVLENHTNSCDACPEGDIHACSGFAIIGVVNCCQCEACELAREVRSESGA